MQEDAGGDARAQPRVPVHAGPLERYSHLVLGAVASFLVPFFMTFGAVKRNSRIFYHIPFQWIILGDFLEINFVRGEFDWGKVNPIMPA